MSDANDPTATISLAYSVDADDAFMFHALRGATTPDPCTSRVPHTAT
jgi:predicted solute-binding protein